MLMEFTWYPYTEKFVKKAEKRWGVYKLAGHSKKVLFFGRGNVQKHLPKHLPGSKGEAEGVEFFCVEYFESSEEAFAEWEEAMRDFKKKFEKYPKYNKPLD